MFGLVLTAMRARRAQAATLFALTLLAVAAAAAAPWYLSAAREAVAESDLAHAPASQRVITVVASFDVGAAGVSPVPTARAQVAAALPVPGASVYAGLQVFGSVDRPGGEPVALHLANRSGGCDQVTVDGACPSAPGEVIISRTVANRIGAARGDAIRFSSFRFREGLDLTIVGVYTVRDASGPYWVGSRLLGSQVGTDASADTGDALFTTERTILDAHPSMVDVYHQIVIPPATFLDGPDLVRMWRVARDELPGSAYQMSTDVPALAQMIGSDQRMVQVGVTVGAAQLLVLCWFVLFFSVRQAAEDRRVDVGLLKLRGAAAWRMWTLTALESAVPMLAGAVVGWGAGYLLAPALASAAAPARDAALVALTSLATATAAAAGALVAAIGAELRTLRAPVGGLLRRVPTRRRGWRTDVLELAVVVIALAGVYQGWAELESGGGASLLSLLAPGLLALAIGLLVARVLPWLASFVGSSGLRAGRPAMALTALSLARRPGTHRVLALLIVAVALAGTTAIGWFSASRAWAARASQELGAARVLTVQAPGGTGQLLSVTRAVDPGAHAAMAVAFSPADKVLAVDADRLAFVADWRPEYGPAAANAAALIHPVAPPPIRVVDGTVTLEAAAVSGAGAVTLGLVTPAATQVVVAFDGLTGERRGYQATVSGCPAPAGCRLSFVDLVGVTEVRLFRLEQASGPTLVPPEIFGDTARWRPSVGTQVSGLVIAAHDGFLGLSRYPDPLVVRGTIDHRAFVVDAPSPLPAVLAGRRPAAGLLGDDRLSVFGGEEIPYRVAGTVPVLPYAGRSGLLVDLEYAGRLIDRPGERAVLQVWLSAQAPAGLVDQLRAGGLTVLADESSPAAADRYGRAAPGMALRFQLFTGVVGVLLAAGSLLIGAAVERRGRAAELGALRTQGLSARRVRLTGYGGYGLVVAAGLAAGLGAAVVAQLVVVAFLPVFTDGWQVLPLDAGVDLRALAVAGAVAAFVLGAAALVVARLMVAAVGRAANGGQP